MIRFVRGICLCAPLIISGAATAGVAVIVHPSNQQSLSDTDIKNLFTGKQRSFPDGKPAIVLNLPEGDAKQAEFNTKALGRTDAQLKAYWSKLMFTGKGKPPQELTGAEMLTVIAQNPNAIGLVDDGAANNSVRVVVKY